MGFSNSNTWYVVNTSTINGVLYAKNSYHSKLCGTTTGSSLKGYSLKIGLGFFEKSMNKIGVNSSRINSYFCFSKKNGIVNIE